MTKLINKTILLIPPVLLLSITVLAQEDDTTDVATFVGSYTLWAAIIIGFIASLATLFYANQLKGGVIGTALTFFGAGMLFVVAGFLAVVVSWTDADTQKIVHDLAFILGYVLMLSGAFRLRQIA